jgi:hypothetical protein
VVVALAAILVMVLMDHQTQVVALVVRQTNLMVLHTAQVLGVLEL